MAATPSFARSGLLLGCSIGLLLAGQLGGCKPPPAGPLDDLPPLAGLRPDPDRSPTGPAAPGPTVGLRQILVVYIGVYDPKVRTRFTRPDALVRARHLTALARAEGADFDSLALRFSDDPDTSRDGGDLGVISPGMLHPDLESAAFALGLGQVSDPIETPRGFHILRRVAPSEAQAGEILVSYTGAKRFTPRQARSRDEAAALAEAIRDRLVAGADFSEQAQLYSDRPNREDGGCFPIFSKGSQNPQFEEIVWNLPVGGLSEIVETQTGFHIVGRWPALRIRGRAMRFDFLGPTELAAARARPRAKQEKLHSRAEALAEAEAVRRQVVEEGQDFAALARAQGFEGLASDDGLLQWFGRGEIPYAVEKQAFALQPGAVSAPIESNGAFFLFKRVQ